MVLRCIQQFGNFKVGDDVEVPDGAKFDHHYFAKVDMPGDNETPEGDDK